MFILKVIFIMRILPIVFFVPKLALVRRVSLCLGLKNKVNPHLC